MKIERIEEFRITDPIKQSIRKLLTNCFQEYPAGRIYFKQFPDFRFLVWQEDQLVGHMAVEHRAINLANTIVSIFGIVDLCVDEAFQSQKIASNLLSKLETLAADCLVDFIVLIADQHDLYLNNGFQLVRNTCRWLIVSEQKTLGVGHRKIKDCLMIKPTGTQTWKDGIVDFLGPIF